MSIVFATPAFAHLMYIGCHLSYMALQRDLTEAKVPHDFIFTGNESMVSRARNLSVGRFRWDERFKGYEAFMFIDADIQFDSVDVSKLWNIDEDVTVGAYPVKTPDRPPTTIWIDGKQIRRSQLDRNVYMPCDYAGTGFMMIRRSVFDRLALAHPEWRVEDKDGNVYYTFFQSSIPEDGVEMSEDYFFCDRWKELGGKITVDPSIVLSHWGTYCFRDE